LTEWPSASTLKNLPDRMDVIKGKVALVTGAAQGFGWEIARGLAKAGAHVVIADLNREGAGGRAEELEAEKSRPEVGCGFAVPYHRGIGVDVTDETSLRLMVRTILDTYGGLDIVVSNAGVLKAGAITELSFEDFEFVTRVNYCGFFLVTKNTAPILGRENAAYSLFSAGIKHPLYDFTSYFTDIVEINSKSGLEGSNRNAAYAGSKFGGIGLVQSFALELVEHGIKVNALCPGNFLDGPLWSDPERGLFVQYLRAGKVPGAKTVKDVRKAYESKVPMKRGCTGIDVVRGLLYVVEQRYETGQAVPITGGQVMLR
ncbi:MAG TPA: SDR family NAD(P)-dependent oxidoreductase, partial [Spirochaetales bacterium]|nr:SDR family NAD(P)-dependent oxidoreductase [Spirochaetales bacterium]